MASEAPADLVFTNGAVYTVDGARRWAQAVAVRGGRIAGVGSNAAIVERHAGASSELVDLGGCMLLPGFQDAHVHPPSAGLDRMRIDLSELHTREEYAERIRDYARTHPGDAWLLGGGWAMDVFAAGTPTAAELDRLAPDRPAFISNRDNHGAWVNSRALQIAGVDRGTPDPPDGRFERGSDGTPTGTLHEGAMDAVRRHIPAVTRAEQIRGLLLAQEYLHSMGITAWQDAIVGAYSTIEDSFETYLQLAGDGRLTARVAAALWWKRGEGAAQIDGLRQQRSRASVGRFRAGTVKIMADGVCENFTAAMLDPYLAADGAPGEGTGISFVPAEELQRFVPMLDRQGFQVHTHAIGDRAIRDILDAIERARTENGPNDLRHHVAHLQVVHPQDVPRFRQLGVVANAQPLWAAHEPQMDELTIPFLGAERASWQYPFAGLVRSGAQLAFGSDWPVSSPNPFWGMHVAVNRVEPPAYPYADGRDVEPLLPEERIDLATAIRAFTMGSAYVNHLDAETGSIEVGKLADLVVVDRNLFEQPVDGFHDARVLLTLVEGARVFEAPNSGLG
jgi:predicted amidohydrolase YtcJ